MRLFIPVILCIIFFFYILYLAFIRKNLMQNRTTILYPGLFFVLVWGIIYVGFLR